MLEFREERLNTKKDVRELIKVVEKFSEKAAGTYAAKQADEFVSELKGMLS